MLRLITAPLFLSVLAVAGCAAAPTNLDVSLKRPTDAGKFIVTLQPPQPAPAINQIHSWTISVATPAGVPVKEARISVDGGMPQHGHGLPTRPRVTKELADGEYLLEGMKFSMTGWWEIKLAVETSNAADKVTFNRVIEARASPQ
jgi:YtkA-like